MSFCDSCKLECPGQSKCEDPKVKNIKFLIDDLLGEDLLHSNVRPKEYERMRESLKAFDHSRDWLKEKMNYLLCHSHLKAKIKRRIYSILASKYRSFYLDGFL